MPSGSIDDAIVANYQRYYTDAARDVVRAFNQGKIKLPAGMNWEPVLGARIDAIARARLRNVLAREKIAEGPAADVLVNRWLRDPSGSGVHRIPDVMLKDSHRILDGTIESKTATSPQVQIFVTFSGGYSVEIVRPDVAPFRR